MVRVWHHWEKWECVPAGMYETLPPKGYTPETAEIAYEEFLRDLDRFEAALVRVLSEWRFSCEHFLTNSSLNHIAWLGQASMCIETQVPACFRAGFKRLTISERNSADALAEKYFNLWEPMRDKIKEYEDTWAKRDYADGIPDEVPSELMRLKLAPSYKAIALAILKNDHGLASLGFTPPVSPWYSVIKKLEIESRPVERDPFF